MNTAAPPRGRVAVACAAAVLALALAAACSERGNPVAPTPAGPSPAQPALVASIRCRADTRAHSIQCDGAPLPASVRGYVTLGGQHQYVNLSSSNVGYAGTDFSFDVTVQNLIPQPMGTTDGATPDPNGVRVIFATDPVVTDGAGTITITNADGTGTFTNTNQAYFQYAGTGDLGADAMLGQNETSAAHTWHLDVPALVNSFAFTLYVVTEVPHPNGWVDITGGASHLLTGGTQALTDSVRSVVGKALADQTVTWGTSDGSVATVDADGNVTAVAPGTATITATQGVRSGSVTVAVCPNLAVGEVYAATMPGAASTCFGGGGGTEEFTYMPVNLSSTSSLSLTVTASGIQAVTGPPSPDRLPAGGPLLGRSPASGPAADEDYRDRLLQRDRDLAAQVFRTGKWRVQSAPRAAGGVRRLITVGVPSVGDLMDLDVAQGCSGALDTRVGQVRSIGQHVVVVSDTANPAGGFTTAQYDSIALEFDSLAYPVDTTNFGAPTDLDSNGRVVAFFTRGVNELSPPGSPVVVLGYFTGRDLFSSAPESCPRSNEGEIFYMLVPDPTGAVNSNVRSVSFVRGNTVGTMGHELQHMINASRRVYLNGTWNGLFEDVWLNEGLSHIAEELMFYRASFGISPRQNIVVSDLTTGPFASRRVAAFNTYANANFGRWQGWLQRPDTSGPVKNVDALASRGATWSFLRYSADRLGGSEAALWSSLVNTQLTGQVNLSAALGGATVNDWVRDWTAATYADDAVGGIASQYTHPSWNFRSLYSTLNSGNLNNVYGTRPLSNNVALTLSYSRGGGTAYARFGVPAAGYADVTALSGGVAPTSPYALIVVRTK